MAFSKALSAVAAAVLGAQGIRRQRGKSQVTSIEGVKVHKYSKEANNFIVLFSSTANDEDISAVCKGRCAFEGHPSEGGARFAVVKGEENLRQILRANRDNVELLEADSLDYMIPEIEEGPAVQNMPASSWGLERVGVPSRATTGVGVSIYVQDTGVRVSHKDFGGRAVRTLDLTTGNVVECKGRWWDKKCGSDVQSHGTHCAGTAAGTTYGVASGATVRSVKTLNDQGSGARSWQIMALDWIATNAQKPAVVSMSLGGRGQDPSYTTAIGAVTEAGITVVVAAGNDDSDACNFSPAFAAAAITVGATTEEDARANYSNYGKCVNIMAPGSRILSSTSSSDVGRWLKSGTSMACPHVSGAAALLLEASPSMTSPQIWESIKNTSKIGAITGLKTDDPVEFLWVGA